MSLLRAAAPFAILAALASAPAFAQDGEANKAAVINVMGTGSASQAPDLAVVQLTVSRNAETAAQALSQVNEAMGQVIDATAEFGIEKRDLQTSGLQISPQYRYDNQPDGTQSPPTLVGYEVRNNLSVKVRDIARLGEMLDRSVKLGVNEGGSIDFQIDDDAALQDRARREAVAHAKASATSIAEAAGLRLGRIVEIVDAPNSATPPVPLRSARAMSADMAAKVPIEAGENSVEATVRIVFELQE